jgi:hypothetical protein
MGEILDCLPLFGKLDREGLTEDYVQRIVLALLKSTFTAS